MGPILFALLPLLDIFQTIGDLDLVIKIMAMSYMILWLYAQLRESMLLFGLGTMLAGYFLFINPLPTIIIVIIFVAFVSLGMHLQMLFQFGLFPLLRFFGIELEHPEVAEQQKMQSIEQKVRRGEVIGNVGSTGGAPVCMLQYELVRMDGGWMRVALDAVRDRGLPDEGFPRYARERVDPLRVLRLDGKRAPLQPQPPPVDAPRLDES